MGFFDFPTSVNFLGLNWLPVIVEGLSNIHTSVCTYLRDFSSSYRQSPVQALHIIDIPKKVTHHHPASYCAPTS